MTAYTLILALHSWLRWALLGLLIAVVARSALSWRKGENWSPSHEKTHAALVGVTHLQLIVGLALYVGLSPVMSAFFADTKHAMKDPGIRWFGVEHLFGMVIAIALVHIGRARSRRAPAELRHRRVVTWGAFALLVILGSIPWPGSRTHGRPLLRGISTLDRAAADERSTLRPPAGAPVPTTSG